MTSIRTIGRETNNFSNCIGLHQRSTLSPYLFALHFDGLIRNVQDEVPWCILFVDPTVINDETRVGINYRQELWREALKSKGFKLI